MNQTEIEELEIDNTDIRHADLPAYKEQIISKLFGEVVGFLKSKNLTDGKEFETAIKPIFSCSKKIIWLDQFDKDYQLTIVFDSCQMTVEFGYVKKEPKQVIYRAKLENLRYNISPGSKFQLIDAHQEKYDEFFKEFKSYFEKMNATY